MSWRSAVFLRQANISQSTPQKGQLRPGKEIAVVVLGTEESTFMSRVLEIGPCRIRTLTDRRITAGAAIRISSENTLYLGTVIHSAAPTGQEIVIELEQVIRDIAEVERQSAEWRGSAPQIRAIATA